MPLVDSLADGARVDAEVVVDLSDEPVLGPRERSRLASRALALRPPVRRRRLPLRPAAARAVRRCRRSRSSGPASASARPRSPAHVARLLARDRRRRRRRDGPRRARRAGGRRARARPSTSCSRSRAPAGTRRRTTSRTRRSRGVTTIGCRRAGGGLAGMPFASNVAPAPRSRPSASPTSSSSTGSGAAIPPVATDRASSSSADASARLATGYLNAYRILVSDLVVVVGGDEPVRSDPRADGGPRPHC